MSSLPIRRFRDFVIGFLQIPPRDGHPCLDGWFRSLRPIEDLSMTDSPPECTSLLDTPGKNARPTTASPRPSKPLLIDWCLKRGRNQRWFLSVLQLYPIYYRLIRPEALGLASDEPEVAP